MLREFVVKRKWMTEPEFFADLAIARVLPGTNVSNFSVIAGYRMLGFAGATAGLMGILTAPFLIVIALAYVYERLAGPTLTNALEGAAAAALGFIALIVVKSARHAGKRWFSIATMAAVFVSVTIFHVPLVPVILVMLPISIALVWWKRGPDAR
jgi:chromate transporter